MTWRLSPHVTFNSKVVHGLRTGHSLRPINIILVGDCATFEYGYFAQTVAHGFDLKHCRLALEVKDDLTFRFLGECGVHECVRQRKLVLMPTSFTGSTIESAFDTQFTRLHKYYRRGFSW